MKHGKFILDREHAELLDTLSEASQRPDHFGKVFQNVLKIFNYHHDRELETVMPLLEYMYSRNEKNRLHDVFKLEKAWNTFRDEYDTMLNEHRQMIQWIDEVNDYPSLEEDNISCLARDLKRHIEVEEQIFYPAALMVGELIQCKEL